MMATQQLIISEARELAGQLTSLIELLFEKGTGSGLPENDNVIGLAYNMAHKVEIFLRDEEERQDKEATGK